MKKLFLLLVTFCLLATACNGGLGDDENNPTPSIPKIELSQQTIDVEFEPNTYTISVTSPYYWKAVSDNEWIVVKSEKGDAGTEELSFTVERNENENERKGTIFIYNSPYNLVAELYVIQKAFEPSDIVTNPNSLNFTAEGGKEEIAITANFEYEVSASADWVKITKTKNGITVTASKYNVIGERTANVTISKQKYDISKTIDVTQTGLTEEWSAGQIIRYISSDGNIVTPYKTDNFGANIVSNTYENGEGIILFDAPITSIGWGTFAGCSSLTSVTIPNSVTSIGAEAFSYCSSLTSVTIGNSVTSIGAEAFSYCSSLTSVTIGNSVTSIGEGAFSDCSSLTSVNIPNSVTSIGDYTFYHCSSLTSVTIPNSVTSIGESAFYGCESLSEFYGKFASKDKRCLIVDGELNSFAPAGLTEYTIPNSVTSIGYRAFDGCSSLTSVIIPDSVTSIGWYAFRGCSSLTSVNIPNSVTSIGMEAFSYCSSLTSVNIGNSVTSILGGAFAYCSRLTSVNIPNSVTSIGEYTFYHCTSLTSVTIPNNVTSIGYLAFGDCTSMTSVYCKPTTPPSGRDYMFNNNAPGRKIYVPRNSVSSYKSAQYWSNYADYIVGYNF